MYELKQYLKAINQSKEKLMDTEDEVWEKKYPAYIVNKCLAPFDKQTCLFVNEVNRRPHLENKLQFDFLINSLRRMNRYSPWQKAKKISAKREKISTSPRLFSPIASMRFYRLNLVESARTTPVPRR